MNSKQLPPPLRVAADGLLNHTFTIVDTLPSGDAAIWGEFCDASAHDGEATDAALARAYLEAVTDDKMWRGFWESGLRGSVAIMDYFHVTASPRASGHRRPASMLGSDRVLAHEGSTAPPNPWHPSPELRERLAEWQRKWSIFDALWRAWSGLLGRVSQTTAAVIKRGPEEPPAILARDQQAALDRLLATATAREQTDESSVPAHLLRRWSVPLLVGASGVGKAFICEELARRWGRKAYRRWEIGSWIIRANRSSAATLDQIFGFIEASPQGCVIYLSGLDTLATSRQGDANVSYLNAVLGELDHLKDVLTRRPDPFATSVILIWGGRFAPLWGESEPGGPAGSDVWKLSDAEPLSDASAVAAWLAEHSGLPSGILRSLAPEPLVLSQLRADEAARVAQCLHAALPPTLDGLEQHEIATALAGPQGWRGMSALIESGIVGASPVTGLNEGASQGSTLPTVEE